VLVLPIVFCHDTTSIGDNSVLLHSVPPLRIAPSARVKSTWRPAPIILSNSVPQTVSSTSKPGSMNLVRLKQLDVLRHDENDRGMTARAYRPPWILCAVQHWALRTQASTVTPSTGNSKGSPGSFHPSSSVAECSRERFLFVSGIEIHVH
jgi:hypothetical protein